MIIISACLRERKLPWALASPSSSMKPYQWSVHADDQILVSMFLWGHFAPELWLCCLWIVPSSQYINKSTFGIGDPCVTLQARVASSPDTTLTCGEARLMWIKMKIENTNHEIGSRNNRKWDIKKQSLKRQGKNINDEQSPMLVLLPRPAWP